MQDTYIYCIPITVTPKFKSIIFWMFSNPAGPATTRRCLRIIIFYTLGIKDLEGFGKKLM